MSDHIGVGSKVARSDKMGTSWGLEEWSEQRIQLHALLYILMYG